MSTQQLFIPKKISVGFQNRDDTYSKKLGYIIYWDQTGKLRKEASWNSWRDKDIDSLEVDNIPVEGFVLNKDAGGNKYSYGWNTRNTYARVWDPRGFEFEISVPNLLFILQECDCSKGKGLEGQFVYSWDGTELVLLPITSSDYQNSMIFTDMKSMSVKAKDLVPGATYTTKKQEDLVYLGKFDYYYSIHDPIECNWWNSRGRKANPSGTENLYVFVNSSGNFEYMRDVRNLALLKSDIVVFDYSDLVDRYRLSIHGSRPARLLLKEKGPDELEDNRPYWCYHDRAWCHQDKDGYSILYGFEYYYWYGEKDPKKDTYQTSTHRLRIDGDTIKIYEYQTQASLTGRHCHGRGSIAPWVEPTNMDLWVELESGSQYKYNREFEEF